VFEGVSGFERPPGGELELLFKERLALQQFLATNERLAKNVIVFKIRKKRAYQRKRRGNEERTSEKSSRQDRSEKTPRNHGIPLWGDQEVGLTLTKRSIMRAGAWGPEK